MTDELCINTIRVLSADVVEKAKSGHPGMPLGMAPIAHLVWGKHARYDAQHPKWINRDRILLSNGHGCTLQYVLLHLTGYDLSMDDLKSFRQIHSRTPGHPESFMTPGIECTTGPLGQGIANSVGLAIAQAHLAAKFNKPGFELFNHNIFVFCGDGCQMEGVALEAMSLAGHFGLGKIILLYDDNHITIDGETDLAFTEDVGKKAESFGWHVVTVDNGDTNLAEIDAAITAAKAVNDKPSLIKIRTTIGYGSKLAGMEKSHGAPLGAANVADLKQKFGFNPEQSFHVADEVYAYYRKEKTFVQEWDALYAAYKVAHPELASELETTLNGTLPADWKDKLPKFTPATGLQATRKSSEIVLNSLASMLPGIIGGSADLTGSNLTAIKGAVDFQKETPQGRYIHYGVREHAMAAIANGLVYYGAGFIPYCGTFMVFLPYALGAIRLSALSHLGVIFVATHDSVGLGEDGPTHQPIETLCTLRALPNLNVMRPADGTETAGCYAVAIERRHTPSVMSLSRHELPQLSSSSIEKVAKGAYIVHESSNSSTNPDVIVVATGSEVCISVEAAQKLFSAPSPLHVRVVSMPSTLLYEEQSLEYKRSLFPAGVPVVSVEASNVFGWERYSHVQLGMTSFGASGPTKAVLAEFGFTGEKVAQKLEKVVEHYRGKHVDDLLDRPNIH